jgi:hypothetical protein
MRTALVLDVEFYGLHGVGFAWGAVLVRDGEVVAEALRWCSLSAAYGDEASRKWLELYVLPKLRKATGDPTDPGVRSVRDEFWALWTRARAAYPEIELWGDRAWPVEANFLSACVLDAKPLRYWDGPNPLLDADTLRKAGLIPSCDDVHQPLQDARNTWESMREWWMARGGHPGEIGVGFS